MFSKSLTPLVLRFLRILYRIRMYIVVCTGVFVVFDFSSSESNDAHDFVPPNTRSIDRFQEGSREVTVFNIEHKPLSEATRILQNISDVPRPCLYRPFHLSAPRKQEVEILTALDQKSRNLNHGARNFFRSTSAFGFFNVTVVDPGVYRKRKANSYWLARTVEYTNVLELRHPKQVVAIVDGIDQLFVNTHDSLLSRYERHRGLILFGTEALCDTPECRLDPKISQVMVDRAPYGAPRVFLNGGFILGEAGLLVEMLKEAAAVMRRINCDDQFAFTKLLLSRTPVSRLMVLDYESEFVAVISPAEKHFALQWSLHGDNASVLQDLKSGMNPVAIHFAGIRYTGRNNQKFNRCQVHLARIYNVVLKHLEIQMAIARPRVIVSLTCLPGRVASAKETLEALFSQTFRPTSVVINVPRSPHESQSSTKVFTEMNSSGIIFVRTYEPSRGEDPLLRSIFDEKDPGSFIVTLGDRSIFSHQFLENLVTAQMYNPHSAFGYEGQILKRPSSLFSDLFTIPPDPGSEADGVGVDILSSALGTIYHRAHFPERELKISPSCLASVDIWLSGYLASQGIPRVQISRGDSMSHRGMYPEVKRGRHPSSEETVKGMFCAYSLANSFRFGWENYHELQDVCSIRYRDLEASDVQNEKIDYNWSLRSLWSPCNPRNFYERGNLTEFYFRSR